MPCPPRFGTPRSPDRPTLGPAVGTVARKFGKPLMPWQQYVADVAGEIDPQTGLLAYPEWGLLVPRQSGKSTLVEARATHRCSATGFFGPRQRVVYTAQTRQKAREKWEEDFVADLQASKAFQGRISVHKANGNEHVRFINGSKWGIEAVTEKAGHGGTIDQADIDEAFAHQDFRLEQAFSPAMITRRLKQLAWISTAGWLGASPYLEAKVEVGRRAAGEGRRAGLAYFEWSAPQDADPGDEAVWWQCMPALGHTITVEAIRVEYDKARDQGKLNEFRRAYLNQWVPRDAPDSWQKFSRAAWLSSEDRQSQIAGQVALAFAVSPDESPWPGVTAIAVAGRRGDGRGHGELTEPLRQGTAGLVDRLAELADRHDPCVTVLNPVGASGAFEKELLERGWVIVPPGRDVPAGKRRLQVTGPREYAQACGAWAEDVKNDRWRHLGQGPLDAAAEDGQVRSLADAWAWSWQGATACNAPLEAVTLARHGFMTHGTAVAPPFFGSWRLGRPPGNVVSD